MSSLRSRGNVLAWRGLTAVLLVAGACATTGAPVEPPAPLTAVPPPLLGSIHTAWGPSSCQGTLLDRSYFVTCHDPSWRIPRWVAYHLKASDLPGTVTRKDRFRSDTALPVTERAELADYRGSNMTRGHLAPADDFRRSREAEDATFLLSNMAPQIQALNGGRWRVLESEVQKLASAHGSIWVITGPLFLDSALHPIAAAEFIGNGRVAVPTHFFKVILCEHSDSQHEMVAFLVPHRAGLPGPTLKYAIPVDQLETLLGADLFAVLPDDEERTLEAAVPAAWPIR